MRSPSRLFYRRGIELSLPDLVYQLDVADCDCRIVELLESEHWIDPLLHSPVILFDQVVEVLALMYADICWQDC